jgi:hypothetical protein
MPSDILTLAGFQFDGYSTPDRMRAGGKQQMVIHKLPGGARTIDTLGPDEDNISWSGEFFGNSSLTNALLLDGMRASGQVLPLTFAGQFRSVVIETFTFEIRRYPVWVAYTISCAVYQNPSNGATTGVTSSMDTLVSGDMSDAASAAASPEAIALASGTAPV